MNFEAALTAIPRYADDQGWIARLKSGDQAAFDELIVRFGPTVLRVAAHVLGDQHLAQDAAQEVFLRLNRKLESFDDSRDFGPWLYRITVNVCRDLQRSARREAWTRIEEATHATDTGRTPEEHCEQNQRRVLLSEGLKCLGEKERLALVLRDIEGLSTGQVAAALEITESTVRSQISVARTKLKQWMDGRTRRRT